MAYKDYLSSTHWRNTREDYLKTNIRGRKCWICSATKNLHIHHRRYKVGIKNIKSILGNETKGHLVVLCNKCHSQWHGIYKLRGTNTKDLKNARILFELGATRKQAILFCTHYLVINEILTLHKKGTDWRINKYLD